MLIWEVVTLGSTPYPGMSAAEVMKKVSECDVAFGVMLVYLTNKQIAQIFYKALGVCQNVCYTKYCLHILELLFQG